MLQNQYPMQDQQQQQQQQPSMQDQQQYNDQSKLDCKDGEPILEYNQKVITKIEKYETKKSIDSIKTITQKLTQFATSQQKYVPYFNYPLTDPVKVEISKITQPPYNCNISTDDQNIQTQTKYFLCKYKMIGNRKLSEYIKENPNVQRILDQHNQILKAMNALSEEKKLIHHAIKDNNIIVKETDDIPVITNFKEAAFLYYDQELNIENFETILQPPSDIHCIEAHILLYLGKKKQENPDIEQWKKSIYDQTQHSEAIQSHTQSQQQYPEYMNKTYEEVYQQIMKTFSKWDIYSITKMFLDISREIQDPENQTNQELIHRYQQNLSELLSKKTIELTDNITLTISETQQQQLEISLADQSQSVF